MSTKMRQWSVGGFALVVLLAFGYAGFQRVSAASSEAHTAEEALQLAVQGLKELADSLYSRDKVQMQSTSESEVSGDNARVMEPEGLSAVPTQSFPVTAEQFAQADEQVAKADAEVAQLRLQQSESRTKRNEYASLVASHESTFRRLKVENDLLLEDVKELNKIRGHLIAVEQAAVEKDNGAPARNVNENKEMLSEQPEGAENAEAKSAVVDASDSLGEIDKQLSARESELREKNLILEKEGKAVLELRTRFEQECLSFVYISRLLTSARAVAKSARAHRLSLIEANKSFVAEHPGCDAPTSEASEAAETSEPAVEAPAETPAPEQPAPAAEQPAPAAEQPAPAAEQPAPAAEQPAPAAEQPAPAAEQPAPAAEQPAPAAQ